MIDADLTEKNERPLIKKICVAELKLPRVCEKLERKEREVTFETAVNTLNDIAGVRVVVLFCGRYLSDCGRSAQTERLTIVKEKNYIRKPKKAAIKAFI